MRLSGRADGLSEVERLMYVHRLLLVLGPEDRLDQVTAELQSLADRYVTAAVVYLKRLRR